MWVNFVIRLGPHPKMSCYVQSSIPVWKRSRLPACNSKSALTLRELWWREGSTCSFILRGLCPASSCQNALQETSHRPRFTESTPDPVLLSWTQQCMRRWYRWSSRLVLGVEGEFGVWKVNQWGHGAQLVVFTQHARKLVWWCTLRIPALGRWMPGGQKFILGYRDSSRLARNTW